MQSLPMPTFLWYKNPTFFGKIWGMKLYLCDAPLSLIKVTDPFPVLSCYLATLHGVLGEKVGTRMCGPDWVPFWPLRFTTAPLLFENWLTYRSCFCKMLSLGEKSVLPVVHVHVWPFDEFFLWFNYNRLSKALNASHQSTMYFVKCTAWF